MIILAFIIQQQINNNMHLLLKKQKIDNQKSNFVMNKNTVHKLKGIIQNMTEKKCILQSSGDIFQTKTTFYSILQTKIPLYSFKMMIQINSSEFFILYKCILLKNEQILTIGSSELRMNFLHKMTKRSFNIKQYLMVRTSQQNGQIQLIQKINYSQLLFQSAQLLMREFELKLKQLLSVSQKMLTPILSEINETTLKGQEVRESRNHHLQKIKHHIYFSCYDLGLSEKASEYRFPSEEILKKRQFLVKNLIKKEYIKEDTFKEGVLYGVSDMRPASDNNQWGKQFLNTNLFQTLLQVPVQTVISPGENTYIFNEIQIDKADQVKAIDLPNSSNGSLKTIMASTAYLFKPEKGKQEQKKVFLNKFLLVKGCKSESVKHKSKLFYEKNIVKLFSFASSGYFLKYYSCSQKDFEHRNSLLMEYNPYNSTLLEHISSRKQSLSIESKLNILSNISNGLRFLDYYKIVHMDLNLNNILICEGHFPKIIDFGESYNLEVVEANYKIPYTPGHTIPYCPPEVFTQKEFTSSQDMFSFGMIIFRLILNAFPFFPSNQVISMYKEKTYHSYFYFCPEKLRAVGQEQICHLLLQMVNVCLRSDPDGRSLPIWQTIIFKEIVAFMNEDGRSLY